MRAVPVPSENPGGRLALRSALAAYAAALLVFSQTWAFAWDESYHLLAAQLILAGRRPYLDFCFPQTPLNTYWNAAWMALAGQSWRVAHAVAALLIIAAVLLVADYAARRMPDLRWRAPAALAAALAFGCNPMVFLFGPLGQPYGLALFALVAAFRFAVRTPSGRASNAALAGLFAGAAAASTLLTAAAAPVLLVWTVMYGPRARWRTAAAFCAGAAIPFAPVIRLFVLGPRQTWFNLVQYHLEFRKLYWPHATSHDIEVLTGWLSSLPAAALGALAAFGLYWTARRSGWTREAKAELYLCAWLALALAAEIGRAHPTFPQYFLLVVPFLAILAAVGLCAAAQLLGAKRLLRPVAVVAAIFILGVSRSVYMDRENTHWSQYERIAAKLAEVTPPGAAIYANEPIYFLLRRIPPPGFELYYTHKLDLPAADRALYHILTSAEVKRQVQSGRFMTAYSCEDDEIEDLGLRRLYTMSQEIGDCVVFWDGGPLRR